eukprot:CAMPEP_0114336656 /NCGR_PEP_ID=MMETSP0101-20121206/5859_1 /TAXON_ID=38822 ORGANISM="Pteridomonas danica, Strain PT" /NCGR_SAMPLE_ID=MMETSP0101 /ASSEMBLY_ACC=CAM_ASM_000211 /LENGTH=105 /DNA_ID=CAMNT_0001468665 /DNA_START=41 /DNA_END=358 /DNA_ORIENTATION=+
MGVMSPLNIVGMLILIHAAYSAAHYKALVADLNEKTQGPPLDVMVEVAVGFAICMIGSVMSAQKLRPVKGGYDTMNKTFDSLSSPPDFHTFSHRGQVLKSRYPTL